MEVSLSTSRENVSFGPTISIPADAFPDLLRSHLTENRTTPSVEALGRRLLESDFPEKETLQFVNDVCYWGGYSGIAGRIVKNNTSARIRDTLRAASSQLRAGSVFRALSCVNELSGLGTPSFASKHLRFLRPDMCGVFDSVLRDELGIPFNPGGYHDFCGRCRSVAEALSAGGVPCPAARDKGAWLVADAEGALYMYARSLRPSPKRC
jgi:hypothetical protein